MAAKEEEFDVLTFFIYVMVLLTVIVTGFAALNYQKVSKQRKLIKTELRNLKAMEDLALEEELRDWIARDREASASGTGSVADFQALYVNRARQNSLNLQNDTQEGSINHPGGIELPFRLIIRQCRVENLIKFLVSIEEEWPGARVKQIVKLDYIERKETKGWDAVVVLSIYKADA